jgi:type II secretory pathway pseudopilin PulG
MSSASSARAARGFLILELLLALALSALCAGLLLTLLTQWRATQTTLGAMDTLNAEAELILDTLAQQLGAAVPGSLRLDGTQRLDWLVRAGGARYRRAARADGSGDAFDAEALTGAFELIGGLHHRPGTLGALQARTGSDLAGCGQGALCLLFDAAADPAQPGAWAAVTAIDADRLAYRRGSAGAPGDGSPWVWLYTDGAQLRCAPETGRLHLTVGVDDERLLSRHLVDCRLRVYPPPDATGARLVGVALRLERDGQRLALDTQIAVRGRP